MRTYLFIPCTMLALGLSCANAPAQPASSPSKSGGPIDLSTLPAEIKSLNWRDVDFAGAPPLDRARALLLLNDALDEISAQSVAEADLMSNFIQVSNLGADFAAAKPVADTAPLTYADVQKIALALMRGPMSGTSYATQLGGTAPDVLGAYEQMYSSSTQRKWTNLSDARLRVRAMARFLHAANKFDAYLAWVPGELAVQAEQAKAMQAQQAAAAATQQAQRQEKQLQAQEKQIQQQQQMLQQQNAQMQQQVQAAQQMQQSLCTAQQYQSQAQANAAAAAQANAATIAADAGYPAGYPSWYYGGLGGVGGVAGVGAAGWYRNGAYLGAAQARTDARFAGWHGGVHR